MFASRGRYIHVPKIKELGLFPSYLLYDRLQVYPTEAPCKCEVLYNWENVPLHIYLLHGEFPLHQFFIIEDQSLGLQTLPQQKCVRTFRQG